MVPLANLQQTEVPLKEGTVVARGTMVEDENFFKLTRRVAAVGQIAVKQQEERPDIVEDDLTIGEKVATATRNRLIELLNRYKDVTASTMAQLGKTTLTTFDIQEYEGSHPVRCKPYRLSLAERPGLQAIIDQLEEADMIEPSSSPYASPVLLVKKGDGTWRLVIDYRKLNQQTVRLNYPLPLIDDILDECVQKSVFSTFDLCWGYFQIAMTGEAARKAAFVTHAGHYQPKVMMMGLCNAPAKFQELMTQFRKRVGKGVAIPYLDDVICVSEKHAEQLEQIERILQAFREVGLTIRLKKCKFLMDEVQFLGFKLSRGGVQPGEAKAEAIAKFPVPKNAHEVRRFLGLTSFFRRFVENYAKQANPLTKLLKKDAVFIWEEKCQRAFEMLRGELTRKPVLQGYVQERPTELQTDASHEGLGGC